MQVNSKKGLKAGRTLHSTFGSWKKVRDASDVRGGIYVIKADAVRAARSAIQISERPASSTPKIARTESKKTPA